ncbi:MAG: tRNA uridine-5-carboxymethylaminomethyl(34) synthesis GTPase MnmE [Deltaproteobacteria bacterium]|nr:tRNA uridine-5-carboxymethylaminomethyl(34) synthesis GTPase MnmE [Deltaproteobacteria bacterium]
MPSTQETIAAVATPAGQGGIGIIRVSGPLSLTILKRVFKPRRNLQTFQSHRLHLGDFHDPAGGKIVDEVLVSFMKGPHSYTREDLVEINSHSGYFLVFKILQVVLAQGARLARPGEFTLRAYLNGRIDLTQAEAVVDLINARSDKGLQLASRQIRGAFREEVEVLMQKAVDILARVEAAIDFPDDVQGMVEEDEMAAEIERDLTGPLAAAFAAQAKNRVWVEGVKTVIAGRVNVGKSSLLNRLLNKQRAIVTPTPGTTRDAIESTVTIDGVPLCLVDTAGLRRVDDEVEKMGIHLTEQNVSEADFLLVVIDQSRALNNDDYRILDRAAGRNALVVVNKIDLPPAMGDEALEKALAGFPSVRISALTGEGMAGLTAGIVAGILGDEVNVLTARMASRVRSGKAMSEAGRFFADAAERLSERAPMEIVAVELKSGMDALGEITGETTTEDVLDSIFSQFCLGK